MIRQVEMIHALAEVVRSINIAAAGIKVRRRDYPSSF
jgi:hypothetical protein